jgi:hypothetical protein
LEASGRQFSPDRRLCKKTALPAQTRIARTEQPFDRPVAVTTEREPYLEGTDGIHLPWSQS